MNKGKNVKLIILILLLVLLVILVIQNLTPVPVKFFLINIEGVPVITLILVSLLTGYIFGLLTYNLLFKGNRTGKEDKKKKNEENKLSDNFPEKEIVTPKSKPKNKK